MFCDIADRLDCPQVHALLAESAFDRSSRAIERKAAAYRENPKRRLFGWIEDGEVLGLCGAESGADLTEIVSIAVCARARGRGIGRAMVAALKERCETALAAETDDDAVGFYRKCGFQTTETERHGVRRWKCLLEL